MEVVDVEAQEDLQVDVERVLRLVKDFREIEEGQEELLVDEQRLEFLLQPETRHGRDERAVLVIITRVDHNTMLRRQCGRNLFT